MNEMIWFGHCNLAKQFSFTFASYVAKESAEAIIFERNHFNRFFQL